MVDVDGTFQEPLVGHQLRCVSQGEIPRPAWTVQGNESGLYQSERIHNGGGEWDRVGGDEPAAQSPGSGVVAASRRARGGAQQRAGRFGIQ